MEENNIENLNLGICISDSFCKNIYNNGINLNTIVFYDFFVKCGFNVFFLIHEDTNIENYKLFKDSSFNIVKYNYNIHTFLNNFIKIDYVFNISFLDGTLIDLLKLINPFMKIIYVCLGNALLNFINHFISNSTIEAVTNYNFDEVWISPHFKFSKFFYDIYWKNKVYICPYVWGDNLIKDINLDFNFDKLNIGIVEPNIHPMKNCIIPISICENAETDINRVYVFNSYSKINDKNFIKFVNKLQLFKNNKISFEHRLKLVEIFKYCNCIVSFTENWDLNYVFFECFYFGIPLIHNSELLKDYGYYYPNYDVNKGVEQIKNILKYHDREKYIEKHKKVLEYYSINNTMAQSWVINRLNNKNNIDFS